MLAVKNRQKLFETDKNDRKLALKDKFRNIREQFNNFVLHYGTVHFLLAEHIA